MKKHSSFRSVLILIMLLICLTLSVSAEEPELNLDLEITYIEVDAPQEDVFSDSLPGINAALMDLDTYLYTEMSKSTARIDVRAYNLSESGLTEAIINVRYNHPDLFYVSKYFEYGTSNGRVVEVYPDYTMSGSTLTTARAVYEQKLNEIMSLVDPNWSELEKILFFNDYLVTHFAYDTTYNNYDAYSFLTEGTGVCQAYYLTCKALLDKCLISSGYGRSDNANHVWNLVKIGNDWYHMDVTWNDPLYDNYDIFGYAGHTYFLFSTQAMLSNPKTEERTDWKTNLESLEWCNDTRYDDLYWKTVDAPYAYVNGQWYYFADQEIYVTSDPTKIGTVVIQLDDWPVVGTPNFHYEDSFSGLGQYKNWMIYNTAHEVIAYDPITGKTEILFEETEAGLDIYGLVVTDSNVVCILNTALYGNDASVYKKETIPLSRLDIAQSRTYHGITVQETEGTVTITGTSTDDELFWIMVSGYTENMQLCDIKVVRSDQLEETVISWTMEGKTIKLFILSDDYCPVG